MLRVTQQRGVHLPDHDLWLDPRGARAHAFVSHAHSDHTGRHKHILATPATARLMRARLGGKRVEDTPAFGETIPLLGGRATLLPAGHILGSAQIHFESEHGSVLYTGDFKLRPSAAAERTEWRNADTLIMETTFGLPRYRMPPVDEVRAQLIAWCRSVLDEVGTPVLLAYSLGKAQELVCMVRAAGLPVMLHPSVWDMTEIYRELMPGFPRSYARFKASQVGGHVLIWPPSAARDELKARIPGARTAMVTGWAVDPGVTYRYRCDAAFPISDHADYDDLLRYVDLVKPRQVLTLHGFAAEFAADLRRRGVEAWSLTEEDQMELML